MEFRNTLIMSIMLVTGFVCLHFYEKDVKEEYYAHYYALDKIVDEKLISISALSYTARGHKECKSLDRENAITIKEEGNLLNDIIKDPSKLSDKTSQELLEKYGIEYKSHWKKEGLPILYQNQLAESMLNQIDFLFWSVRNCEIFRILNAHDVVIDGEKTHYKINKNYELNFKAVRLNTHLPQGIFHLDIDGTKFPVDHFPVELNRYPEKVTFYGNIVNPVTGESRPLNEVYKIKPQNQFP